MAFERHNVAFLPGVRKMVAFDGTSHMNTLMRSNSKIISRNRSGKVKPNLEYTYFINTFNAILYSSQALIFVYCIYESITAKLTTTQIPLCVFTNSFPISFARHHTKKFQIVLRSISCYIIRSPSSFHKV